MAENSKIEWTDHTFNPWIGCTKVSPGCEHCYAETLNTRYNWTEWGPGGRRLPTSQSNWNQTLKWDREARQSGTRKKVFCASLADWLDPKGYMRVSLLDRISITPDLDWLLLTKRPEMFHTLMQEAADQGSELAATWIGGEPPVNVWVGVSAENQEYWDKRIPKLLEIPATIHFVSAEPLLGPIDMGSTHPDWLIVGGESGPNARPIDPDWVRSLRDQCKDGDHTAFFFKQWGGTNKKVTGRELDGNTHSEFPQTI